MLKSFSFVAKHGGINTNSDIDTEKDDEFFSHLMTSDDLDIPDVVLPEPEMTAAQKAAKWFRETTSMREEDIESVRGVLDTLTVGLFMAVCTVVALFLTDINGMIGTRESDDNVSNCMFALFIIFILELTLESLIRPNYFSSMFFWLDILAIASMINDIPTAAGFVGLPRSYCAHCAHCPSDPHRQTCQISGPNLQVPFSSSRGQCQCESSRSGEPL